MRTNKLTVILIMTIMSLGVFSGAAWAQWQNPTTGILYTTTDNVGIGTDSPSARLHVAGNLYFRDGTCDISSNLETKYVNQFRVYLNDSNNIYGYVRGNYFYSGLSAGKQIGDASNLRYMAGLFCYADVSNSHLYGDSYSIYSLSYASEGGVIHGNSISVYGYAALSSTSQVTGDLIGVYGYVHPSSGQVGGKRWAGYFYGDTYINDNVGIGNVNPSAKLDILGAASSVGLKVEGAQGGLGVPGLVYINNTGDSNTLLVKSAAVNQNDRYIADFSNSIGSVMRINGGGNVGIGTTTPDAKLAVNGTIKAREVRVTTSGWSDFVFDKGYKLPTLDKVESYINENKHLPDVPSAQEVRKDGIDVSDMMAKQMQKIEELTLYMIELKKENEALKNDNQAIKERLSRLDRAQDSE